MATGVAKTVSRFAACAAVLGAAAGAAGCATAERDADADAREPVLSDADPYESDNRAVFDLNERLDRFVLEPVAEAYVDTVPIELRDAIHDMLVNLTLPADAANALLQGESIRATRTLGRFAINTTVGIAGLVDVATMVGIEKTAGEDFGQTLAVWGVDSGPYLMLPLLGPTTLRHGTGRLVDLLFDPLSYLLAIAPPAVGPSVAAAGVVDQRARNLETFDAARRGSVDLYAAVRSTYLQRRESLVSDGVEPNGDNQVPFSLHDDEGDPFMFLLDGDTE